MPELPEVETIRRQLDKEICTKIITKVIYDTLKMLKPAPSVFINGVKNQKISQIGRRAKLLFINLDNGSSVAIHLKLNGRLLCREKKDPPDDYVHVKLVFADDYELRFADSRKFGFMHFLKDQGAKDEVVRQYGPEPLDDLTKNQFYKILSSSGRRIKDLLMDQKTISGVGNIYANDALWLAQIHPETVAKKLNREEVERLFNSLEEVLIEALREGGASDQWYRQIHGEIGHYQEHFKVYGRAGQPCLRHPEEKIQYLKFSQRGTFICPKCQRKTQ